MPEYLVEIRFRGYAKDSCKEVKNAITWNFHVTPHKIIPHVTLAGPLYTRDEKQLVKEVVNVAKKYKTIKFRWNGFDSFEKNVIYVKIDPSDELDNLRWELAQKLQKFCALQEIDKKRDFKFHCTLALHDIERKFDSIWEFLQTWKIPEIEQHVLRITVLNQYRKILCEYDLMLRKTLNRHEALDREIWHKTMRKLEKEREPSEIKFEKIDDKESVFVIGDTHFDHRNIIRFSHRPFSSRRQMNHELISNWNQTVKDDRIYFLGDLTFGRGRRPIDYWHGKLNGRKYHLRGNHDSDIIERATVIPDRYGIKYQGYEFLLRHKPDRPFGYEGWIIHGDKHNTNLEKYPFINQERKTVNVSAELVNYTPLSLEKLISLIETGDSYITLDENHENIPKNKWKFWK